MKKPSQIFEWFEKMKASYEQSVQSVLDRFEQNNLVQQKRFDKAMLENFTNLKQANKMQKQQYDEQISQLHNDIVFYKQQIAQQNKSIEQLNSRYDAVVGRLLVENNKQRDIKEIFSEDIFIPPQDNEMSLKNSVEHNGTDHVNTREIQENECQPSSTSNEPFIDDLVQLTMDSTESSNEQDAINNMYEKALLHRDNNELEQSFALFEQAAQLGHLKAMGATGRAYFLAEGIDENQVMGLAWLINAADKKLPQAISRVNHFQENDPDLYQQALNISLETKTPANEEQIYHNARELA